MTSRDRADKFFASITRPTRTLQVASGADEAGLERRGGGYCAHAALGVHSDRVGTMGRGWRHDAGRRAGRRPVASLSTDLLGIEDKAAATGVRLLSAVARQHDAQLAGVDVRGFADAELVFGLAMHASAAALAGRRSPSVRAQRCPRRPADARRRRVGARPAWDAVGARESLSSGP